MEDMTLDGNAAAGMLSEVFAPEATAAVVRCASCGMEGAVATARVYSQGPGTVMRCPGCDAVIMRFAEIRGRLVADLRGVGRLMF
jgi:hypothetical protein